MGTTLRERDIKRIDISVVRGDTFRGFRFRHVVLGRGSVDHRYTQFCADIFDGDDFVTSFNIETYQNSGWVTRLWLPAQRSALLTRTVDQSASLRRRPNAELSDYRYFVRQNRPTPIAVNFSLSNQVVTASDRHELSVGDKVLFLETSIPEINENTYQVSAVLSPTEFLIDNLPPTVANVLGGQLLLFQVKTLFNGVVLSFNSASECF